MSPKEESRSYESQGGVQVQGRQTGAEQRPEVQCHWIGEDAGDSIFTQRESRDDYTR